MITSSEMKKLEDSCGVPKLTLMENAGKNVADLVLDEYKPKRILIVCYHGNNGGDGFVAARYLANVTEVDVLFLGEEDKLKDCAKSNWKKLDDYPHIQILNADNADIDAYDLIIDAIFGTGIKGEIKDPVASVIKNINESSAKVVAVDVPSGVDPDSGKEADVFVEADLTITFHDMKKGLEKFKNIEVVDIGIK